MFLPLGRNRSNGQGISNSMKWDGRNSLMMGVMEGCSTVHMSESWYAKSIKENLKNYENKWWTTSEGTNEDVMTRMFKFLSERKWRFSNISPMSIMYY